MLEALEDRSLMAAIAGGLDQEKPIAEAAAIYASAGSAVTDSPVAVTALVTARSGQTAAAIIDDRFEENDSRFAARNLGTMTGPTTFGQLALADGNDWYRFSTTRTGTASDSVSISFLNAQGNLNLQLYNSVGQRVRSSGTISNTERISLNGLGAGIYYIRVFGVLGARNPDYSLSFAMGQSLADDAFEQNDTAGAARDLGTLTAAQTFSNLVMADGLDWYRFSMNGAGTTSDFVGINFQNVQGNLTLRLYTSSGLMVGSSATTSNFERVSLAGLAPGSYLVQVVGAGGATNPNYSLQIDPAVTSSSPSPSSTGGFNVEFAFTGMTTNQRAIFDRAAQKWEAVITGDLPNATFGGTSVDDLLIRASSVAIDGRGNILGQAGPDRFRSSTGLPYVGTMEFDSADMASMEANGTLYSVVLHEMGHVLGIGTLWSSKGLILGEGTSNPRFIGSQAIAAYNGIFGGAATSVPVENTGGAGTRDGHWRESIFKTELMTGWVGPGSSAPLSRITVGSLADLGYSVNYAGADSFARPSSLLAAAMAPTNSDATAGTMTQLVNLRMSAFASQQAERLLSPVRRPSIVEHSGIAPPHASQQGEEVSAPGVHKATPAAVDAVLTNWLDGGTGLWDEDFLTGNAVVRGSTSRNSG